MTTPLALLYVDDDPDIRTIVELALGLDPAIAVCTAASGAAALALVATADRVPDVIVLDVMMPDMSGAETLQALRQHPALADTPAVFMTAKGRGEDVTHYKRLGAIGVILKPFDPILLAKEIRALLADS